MNWPRSYRRRNANTRLDLRFHFVPLTAVTHGRLWVDRASLLATIPSVPSQKYVQIICAIAEAKAPRIFRFFVRAEALTHNPELEPIFGTGH